MLDKPSRASELLLALANLRSEGKLVMHDAVIVAKDDGGRTQHRGDGRRHARCAGPCPAPGGGCSAACSSAGRCSSAPRSAARPPGALYGKLVDRGLEDEWVKDMAAWIDPGTSALLLLVDAGLDPAVLEELKRFEGIGRVAGTTLPDGIKAEIEAALGQALEPALRART